MYVDFEYYRDTYGGTDLTEAAFPAAGRKAESYIRYLTYINGDIFADTAHTDIIKTAVCAAADVIGVYEARQKAKGKPGAMKSENNDGYSATFVTEQQDGQTAEEALRKKVFEAVRVYLLPTGWLSRKAGVLCDY